MKQLFEELKITFDFQCWSGFLFTIVVVLGCGIVAGIARIIINLTN